MSEKSFEVWDKVVEKGAEKIKRYEGALFKRDMEEFNRLHEEYVAFLDRVAAVTGIKDTELDRCFLNRHLENMDKQERAEV